MSSEDELRQSMAELFGHQPYEFQTAAVEALLDGRSVVLRAPTGAGKTDVALAPTLLGRLLSIPFPRQMIYAVPMRVLATQFMDKAEALLRDAGARGTWTRPVPTLSVQTGERPEDPRFEKDLVFTTIDQALASYLNIPYGLPRRLGNLNAGALATAHLVADEFHLFDVGAALRTTVTMLQTLRGAAPFLLMTATCSDALFRLLAEDLRAVAIEPSHDELGRMQSQQKTRIYERVGAPLTAGAVLTRHQRRSIVVCNTVDRAQDLYEELVQSRPADTEIRLLHSRFLRRDRRRIEDWCRRTFARRAESSPGGRAILVATQVVEVGLDITCEVLHTELAPASAIVQRAGRCARYQGETGQVIVYEPPPRNGGAPNYAPYLDEPQLSAMKATLEALDGLTGRPATFKDELRFVEAAHHAGDTDLCDRIRALAPGRRADVQQTIQIGNRSRTAELIRESDSRTLLVLAEPDQCGNPYAREGFSFQTDTLQGRVGALLQEDTGPPIWKFKIPAEQLPEGDEYGVVSYQWELLTDPRQVRANPLIAVNPAFVHYHGDIGFRFRPGTPCESPLLERASEERAQARYVLTRYSAHIRGLYAAYERGAERLAIAVGLIARACKTEAETVDRLARACLALHDAGKLSSGWVAWATAWEQAIGRVKPGEPLPWLVSHTDYDSTNDAYRRLMGQVRPRRPSHAAEGALISRRVMERLAGGEERLWRPALAAIARHHSPFIEDMGAYRLESRAAATLEQAMDVVGLPPPSADELVTEAPELKHQAASPLWRSSEQLVLYFFLVRILRQADQASFAELDRLGLRPDGITGG